MSRRNLHAALSLLMLCAASAGVSSCASRVETHLAFPPVADLKTDPEPVYPEAALQPGPVGEQAEREWWNQTLVWGRTHRDRVARVCAWARDLGHKLPEGYCGAP